MLPEFLDFTLKSALDEKISLLYQGEADVTVENDENGLEIKEPYDFSCKYFW